MDIQRVETYMKRVAESETKTFTPVGDKLKVGLDLGTAYIVMVVLDEENNPIACEKQAADVLRDGVVVDYLGALNIVKALKAKLEQRIGKELVNCAIAMPAGTDDSVKTHTYVAEGAELEVTAVLDEPSAANAIYQISDGVIVDVGRRYDGACACFIDGKVVRGRRTNRQVVRTCPWCWPAITIFRLQRRKPIKQDYSRTSGDPSGAEAGRGERWLRSFSRTIVCGKDVDTIYLCGGTCCLTGMEKIIEKETGIPTIKPAESVPCHTDRHCHEL